MIIRSLNKCMEVRSGDGTLLRELFNPHTVKDIKFDASFCFVRLEAGKSSNAHALKTITEIYHIVSGKGEMHIDDEVEVLEPGDAVYIPSGAKQFIKNLSDTEELTFYCITNPAYRLDDEIVY